MSYPSSHSAFRASNVTQTAELTADPPPSSRRQRPPVYISSSEAGWYGDGRYREAGRTLLLEPTPQPTLCEETLELGAEQPMMMTFPGFFDEPSSATWVKQWLAQHPKLVGQPSSPAFSLLEAKGRLEGLGQVLVRLGVSRAEKQTSLGGLATSTTLLVVAVGMVMAPSLGLELPMATNYWIGTCALIAAVSLVVSLVFSVRWIQRRNLRLQVHEQGLVYQSPEGMASVRWEDITKLKSTVGLQRNGEQMEVEGQLSFHDGVGGTWQLSPTIEHFPVLAELVAGASQTSRLRRIEQHFQRHAHVGFGAIGINRVQIRYGGSEVPWAEVKNLKFNSDHELLVIDGHGKVRMKIPMQGVPDADICQVLGTKIYQATW